MTPMRRIVTSSTFLVSLTVGLSIREKKNKPKLFSFSERQMDSDQLDIRKKAIDDCLNPACHSTMELLKKFNKRKKTMTPKSVDDDIINKTHQQQRQHPSYCIGCPVDKEKLGRGTWDLIHTIAATYPENPSVEQMRNTELFFRTLSDVYPCPYCAADFQRSIQASPPR